MKSLDQIKREMCVTHDPVVLHGLLREAIEHAEFNASRWAFAHEREKKYQAQIERQKQTITALENALYGKKK